MDLRIASYASGAVLALIAGALVAFGFPGSLVLPLLVCLGILETIIALRYAVRRQRDPFSVLALLAFFYLLAFTAGAVYFHLAGTEQGFTFTDATLNAALALGLLAFAALSIGYVANPLRPIVASAPRFPVLRPGQSPLTIAIPLLALGWCGRLVQVATGGYFHTRPLDEVSAISGATGIVEVLAALPTLAVALIGASAYLGRLEPRSAFLRLFWALIALEVLWFVPSGDRGQVVGVLMAVVLVAFYARGRRLPWRIMVATAIVIVFGLFPFIETYRGDWLQQHVYQRDPGKSLNVALDETTSRSIGETAEAGLDSTFSRFSDVASVASILTRGRDVMGLAPGETLGWTLEAALPRFIYPGKDDPGAFGNRFAREYDILVDDNRVTSMAITQPGEFYLNFGWLGVIVGMALVGSLYRAINDFLGSRRSDPAAVATYAVIAWPLLNGVESIIVVGLVGVLKFVVVDTVLIWLFGRLSWRLPFPRRLAASS
jgi:hypothetical protein